MGIEDIKVEVTRFNPALKCARCWKCDYDVGVDKEFPELCGKCVSTLRELGWTREMIGDPNYVRNPQTGQSMLKQAEVK